MITPKLPYKPYLLHEDIKKSPYMHNSEPAPRDTKFDKTNILKNKIRTRNTLRASGK